MRSADLGQDKTYLDFVVHFFYVCTDIWRYLFVLIMVIRTA